MWKQWAFICMVSSVVSCKMKRNLSEADSLGNFAGGNTVNQCSGPYALSGDEMGLIVDDDGNRLSGDAAIAMANAMSAVPVDLRAAFFGSLNGQIILTSRQDVCGGDGLSCWQISSDDNEVAIFVKSGQNSKETRENIGHATVRAFGYLLSEVILKSRPVNGQLELSGSQDLEDSKQLIAYQFLGNIRKSNGKYDINHFSGQLDQRLLSANLTDDQFTAVWESVGRDAQTQKFADSVFAETFDSFYCSDQTRQEMVSDFAHPEFNLSESYALINDQIATQLSAAAAALQGGGADQSGLKLAPAKRRGRLFRGRTPIRNTFRAAGSGLRQVAQGTAKVGQKAIRVGANVAGKAVDAGKAVVQGAGTVVTNIGRKSVEIMRSVGSKVKRTAEFIGQRRQAGKGLFNSSRYNRGGGFIFKKRMFRR